jgi:CheY-like chemotaxis protein
MPEMDGCEATAEIRRRAVQAGGHLTILAMTAHAMEGDRERCLAVGMDGFIAKPFNADALASALLPYSAVLRGRSDARSAPERPQGIH